MGKIKQSRKGIALLTLLLLVSTMAVTGWSKVVDTVIAFEAHINEVVLGHDKKMTEPSDEFGTEDTIFAAVVIAENKQTVKVKARLHVVNIAGQKPGPIPGLETVVTLKGEGVANFNFSKPTKGWPLGKYKFEALLINEAGETIDTESHEFTVE